MDVKRPKILYFDLNSLLHDCASYVYAYGEHKNRYSEQEIEELKKQPLKLEQDYMEKLISLIEAIIDQVQPETSWIGIDGVCPIAKIQQQRWRRFKSKKESPFDFSSVMISPGTEFMERIHKTLLEWSKGKNVIYNDETTYLTPQEAEHKILKDVKGKKGEFVIYGLDNDLVILSVLHSSQDCRLFNMKREVVGDRYYFVDAYQMKKNILFAMNTNTIEDFVLLTFFVGNDFIPAIFGYDHALSDTLSHLITAIYAPFSSKYKPLVNEGKIDYSNFYEFLTYLHQKEAYIYKLGQEENTHPVVVRSKKDKNLDLSLLKTFYKEYVNKISDQEYCLTSVQKVKPISHSWFQIVNWNLDYYLEKNVSTEVFYNHYHAPIISFLIQDFPSLVDIQRIKLLTQRETPFLSIPIQMACILPIQYLNIVKDKKVFKKFIHECPQYFPKRVKIMKDGLTEKTMYQEKIVLPFIQPSLLHLKFPQEFK